MQIRKVNPNIRSFIRNVRRENANNLHGKHCRMKKHDYSSGNSNGSKGNPSTSINSRMGKGTNNNNNNIHGSQKSSHLNINNTRSIPNLSLSLLKYIQKLQSNMKQIPSSLASFTISKIIPSLFRIPMFIVLFYILHEDTISPIPIVFDIMHGPSMIPSIYSKDIYLRLRPMPFWFIDILSAIGFIKEESENENKRTSTTASSGLIPYSVGDLVIIQDYKGTFVCKRIIGLEGDTVWKYGQFAIELYNQYDDFGIRDISMRRTQSSSSSSRTAVILPPSWEDKVELVYVGEQHIPKHYTQQHHQHQEPKINPKLWTKVRIPKGHIWVEGDNPLHSIDSRHYGPVSMDNVRGKIIYRLWPRCREQIQHGDDDNIATFNSSRRGSIFSGCFVSKERPIPLTEDEMQQLITS